MVQRLLLVCLSTLCLQLSGCGRLFFYPEKELLRTPADIGIAYEDVSFSSTDGMHLHGWFLPAKGYARATIVFFHGNAENISSHVGAVFWLPAEGYNVFILDYRGFGRSEGKPDIRGVNRDALAALDYIASRKEVDPDRLVVFGQSVGAAIALYVAAKTSQPIHAVVAESAFTSYPAIMREKMSESLFTWPLQWLSLGVTSRYDPLKAIHTIHVPVLLIHGDRDKIIPIHHARVLYAAANEPRQLWVVKGGGHISAFAPNRLEYRKRFTLYLEGLFPEMPVSSPTEEVISPEKSPKAARSPAPARN